MSLIVKIRNVGGVERADIETSLIAILSGPNGSGKTSILRAAGAALTGITIPVDGISKGGAGALVRTGAEHGGVQVKLPTGEASLRWPQAELKTEGGPPQACAIAVGLLDLMSLSSRELVKEMARYIKGEPSDADLVEALKKEGIAEATAKKVAESVEGGGWDATHAKAKDKGVALKGMYEQATGGQRWGSDKGGKFLPANWSEDLETASVDALEAAIVAGKKTVETAVASQAVGENQVEQLRGTAAGFTDLQAKLAVALKAEKNAVAAVEDARRQRAALPPAEGDTGIPCPHCGEPVLVVQKDLATRVLEKGTKKKTTDTELKKRRLAILDADGVVTAAERTLEEAQRTLAGLKIGVGAAETAALKLKEMEGKTGSVEAVDKAREGLRAAEQNLAAFKAKMEADKLHAALLGNQAIVRVLAPEGLRKTAMQRALEAFNEKALAPLCKVAGWKAVELDENFAPTYGGRSYVLLSGGEQYRVRATMQVAIAQLDQSKVVILDGADILDGPGRNGLLKLLRAWGQPALVGMTFSKQEQAPDISVNESGVTYWLTEGSAVRIDELRAGQKAA